MRLFIDGENFDLYTESEAASLGLERLAEDGSIEGIAAEFNAQVGDNGVDATIIAGAGVPGPIDPGESSLIYLRCRSAILSVGGFFTLGNHGYSLQRCFLELLLTILLPIPSSMKMVRFYRASGH